jgi:hypothetical protein
VMWRGISTSVGATGGCIETRFAGLAWIPDYKAAHGLSLRNAKLFPILVDMTVQPDQRLTVRG